MTTNRLSDMQSIKSDKEVKKDIALAKRVYRKLREVNPELPAKPNFQYNADDKEVQVDVNVPVLASAFERVYLSFSIDRLVGHDTCVNVQWCYYTTANQLWWNPLAEIEIDSTGEINIV